MDLKKKRDELNPYAPIGCSFRTWEAGFDACAEILSAEIKELEKALEFYADLNNWHSNFGIRDRDLVFDKITPHDLELVKFFSSKENQFGGKLARETLAKLRTK